MMDDIARNRSSWNLLAAVATAIQWHIFNILIVSCASALASTISLVGIKVYNIPLKFQRDCTYKS